MSSEEIRAAAEQCIALIPGDDDEPWVAEQPYADDAAAAVAYTLRTMDTGEPQEAAWAARRAYECTDQFVLQRIGLKSEAHVLAQSVIQRELVRQQRDLDELLSTTSPSASLYARLRERARVESASMLVLDASEPGA